MAFLMVGVLLGSSCDGRRHRGFRLVSFQSVEDAPDSPVAVSPGYRKPVVRRGQTLGRAQHIDEYGVQVSQICRAVAGPYTRGSPGPYKTPAGWKGSAGQAVRCVPARSAWT